jgi:hypothetical protein
MRGSGVRVTYAAPFQLATILDPGNTVAELAVKEDEHYGQEKDTRG